MFIVITVFLIYFLINSRKSSEINIPIVPQENFSNQIPEKIIEPFLYFPLKGKSPFNNSQFQSAQINSIFDHDSSNFYRNNGRIVSFTGDLADSSNSGSENDELFAAGYTNKDGVNFDFGEKAYYRGANMYKHILYYDGHPGYDFESNNDNVYAPADGIVYIPEVDKINGNPKSFNTVVINHGNGYESWFLHFNKIFQTEGEIKLGDIIGVSGSRGTVAPHLHYELRYKGVPIDPYGWNPNENSEIKIDPYKKDDKFINDSYFKEGLNLWSGFPAVE